MQKVVKTIVDKDANAALLRMNEWFYRQNEYDEGDMLVVINPCDRDNSYVDFIVEV